MLLEKRWNACEDKRDASEELIGPLNKGHGYVGAARRRRRRLSDAGWNLLREDLSLPAAVLYRDRLEHNLRWMQRFIDAYGVKLAPHGKTTMAPRLFDMQLDGGAWGITLATAHQAHSGACAWGAARADGEPACGQAEHADRSRIC